MANCITGEIVEVDPEGNLVTDITDEMLAKVPRDETVAIRCDTHETRNIFATNHDQPPMTLIAMLNSTGRLQITIVDDSAKIMLGVTTGTAVEVVW